MPALESVSRASAVPPLKGEAAADRGWTERSEGSPGAEFSPRSTAKDALSIESYGPDALTDDAPTTRRDPAPVDQDAVGLLLASQNLLGGLLDADLSSPNAPGPDSFSTVGVGIASASHVGQAASLPTDAGSVGHVAATAAAAPASTPSAAITASVLVPPGGSTDAAPLAEPAGASGTSEAIFAPIVMSSSCEEECYEPENNPPEAFEDEFYTTHDVTLTVSAPGVLDNDDDLDFDELSAVLEDEPTIGTLDYFGSDGSFQYTPPESWTGQVTFTYRASDGMDLSEPATVYISVTNEVPWPEDDGVYYIDLELNPVLEISAPGVLANDGSPGPQGPVDADGDLLTAVLDQGPQHASSFTLNPDGSFEYEPDPGYAGGDTFTYFAYDGLENSVAATVTLQIMPYVDLIIHHGQTGSAVAANKEVTVGAFTVANLNDTDGDGLTDNDGVIATTSGRDEVDLMKLIIKKPNPDNGGNVTLTVMGSAALWEESTKVNEIELTDGSVTFPTSALDKTIWVELTAASGALRDVTITLSYGGASDTVKATAVWATLAASEHDTKDAADLLGAQGAWNETPNPVRDSVETLGGTGLRPIGAGVGVRNVILQRWTASPTGVQNEPGLQFDITRRKESNAWALDEDSNVIGPVTTPFEVQNEQANDDQFDDDETDEPNTNGHMFVVDAVGLSSGTAPGGWEDFEYHADFEEFIRVRFNGEDPAGNTVSGSRSSSKFYWHARHQLVNVDGTWARTTGDQTETAANNNGPGHITIPD